ncbi:hypothetical protein GCM10027020_09420 [Nocardioides salsibiostraticola]
MRRADPLALSAAGFAGVVALCCAFPVLLTLGLLGTVLGWTLNSWVLVGFGSLIALLGLARTMQRRKAVRA